jgi:hypothetical protein
MGSWKLHTFCPHTVFLWFLWISQKWAIISLYSINLLIFTVGMVCVHCVVGTETFNTIQVNSPIKSVTESPNVYVVRSFTTIFTNTNRLILHWDNSIKPTLSHEYFSISTSIVFYLLCLRFTNRPYHWHLPTKAFHPSITSLHVCSMSRPPWPGNPTNIW